MPHKFLATALFASLISNTLAQNVGIGTTTPEKPLTIKTNGMGVSQESVDGTSKVGFYTHNNAAYLQTHSNTNLSFSTNNGSAQMTLQAATGNFGIGLTNPTARLDVAGAIKIADGTQGNGKVLTCDADGLASWQTAGTAFTLPYTGTFSTTQTLFAISNDQGNGFSAYTPNNTGMFAVTSGGTAIKGNANSGTGVSAYSGTGTAGVFESQSGLAIKTVSGDVEINGKVKIIDGTQSTGAVLTSNSAGTAIWAKSSGFTTTKIGGFQNIPFTNPVSYTKINFSPDDTQFFGTNGYSTGNSDFTAPVAGFYHFDAMVNFDASTNGTNTSTDLLSLSLYKRNAAFPGGAAIYSNYFYYSTLMGCKGISATVYLAANDIIDVRALNTTLLIIRAYGGSAGGSSPTFFSGYLVH